VNNIQYTAQFGNGVSATIGLDDPTVFNRTVVANLNLPLGATGGIQNAYAGVHAPDIVGNIRIDQAWGLWQISAAGHEVNGSYNVLNGSLAGLPGTAAIFGAATPPGATGLVSAAPIGASEISGHPGTEWGYAVSTALQIKNIPLGPGDDIKMDATWSKGDTKQVISTSATSPSFAMFGGTSAPGAYQSVGFGATTDGVWLPTFNGGDGKIHLTEAWGFRGAYNHNWDPYWSTSLFGSYSQVHYDNTAKAQFCSVYVVGKAVSADFVCNPDFNVAQIGVVTRWTPVKNFTFSAEVMWFNLDQKFAGTALLTPAAPKPTARYEYKDQDAVSLNVRVQRNF
jgi:Porin subfamily